MVVAAAAAVAVAAVPACVCRNVQGLDMHVLSGLVSGLVSGLAYLASLPAAESVMSAL
jgi:hypothetical protein